MFESRSGLKEQLYNQAKNSKLLDEGGLPIYKVKIFYKSGNVEEFWVKKFKIENAVWTWEALLDSHKPIKIGVDDIESVWQIDYDIVPKNKLKVYGLDD